MPPNKGNYFPIPRPFGFPRPFGVVGHVHKMQRKPRLRRARWPRAVCSECGRLQWKGVSKWQRRLKRSICFKCIGICWVIPNLTTGFALTKLSLDKRKAFAKLCIVGDRVGS